MPVVELGVEISGEWVFSTLFPLVTFSFNFFFTFSVLNIGLNPSSVNTIFYEFYERILYFQIILEWILW